MTKTLLLVLFTSLLIPSLRAQDSTATLQLAQSIANRMADSLVLSVQQRDTVLEINKLITSKKAQVRQNYSDRDVIAQALQAAEDSRDNYYRDVLTSEQYVLYKRLKAVLISAN